MQAVFAEALSEAKLAGLCSLSKLLLRELFQTPFALARLYRSYGLRRNLANHFFAKGSAALTPPERDGRFSWRQAGLETGLFLAVGGLMVLATYLPPAWLSAGWQRRLDLLGAAVVLLPVPIFLAGLANGLPRWSFPAGGMLLGYTFLAATRSHFVPFLVTSLVAASVLALAAGFVDASGYPLPDGVRRWGQSLKLDWTRLSFAFYGAMPLAITSAFDDAYVNNRTPWLAISALLMVCGALVYTRSRRRSFQIAALLCGFTLAFWPALLDRASFEGGLGPWLGTAGWMVELWVASSALMLAPLLLGYMLRTLAIHILYNHKRSGL
jgi:hypothetical protein